MDELASNKDAFIQALLTERDRLFQENSRLKCKLEDRTDVELLKSSYEATIGQKEAKIASLEQQVASLLRRIWGKSSERFIKDDPQQRRLDFDGLELLPEEEEQARKAETEIVQYKTRTIEVKVKQKPVRKSIPENIPRVEEHIYPVSTQLLFCLPFPDSLSSCHKSKKKCLWQVVQILSSSLRSIRRMALNKEFQ